MGSDLKLLDTEKIKIWHDALTVETAVFLNNYFKLGLTTQLARDRQVCASTLARTTVNSMTKDEIKLLMTAENKRVDLLSDERKKNWELLTHEELKVAAKIFLISPYPETRDDLIAALARTHDACPPGLLRSVPPTSDQSFGFAYAPQPPIKPSASAHSRNRDFSRQRRHGLGKGTPHMTHSISRSSRSRSRSHSRSRSRSRKHSRSDHKSSDPNPFSSLLQPTYHPPTSTSSASSSTSSASFPSLQMTSSVSPGRYQFQSAKKVIRKIREGTW